MSSNRAASLAAAERSTLIIDIDPQANATSGLGLDKNSAAGDPTFVDPASGDFRVGDDSPALKLGFENFPMDQFGVISPNLRAEACTPRMPGEPSPAEASRQRDLAEKRGEESR